MDEDKNRLQKVIENVAKISVDFQELVDVILRELPVGVLVKNVNDDFKCIYWNQFIENFTGIKYSTEEKDYNSLNEESIALFTGNEQKREERKVVKTGEKQKLYKKLQRISGDFRDVEITKFPVTLKNGTILLLTLLEDVTELVTIRKSLERTNVIAKKTLHTNDIWIASLKINPLSKINYDDTIVSLNSWDNIDSKLIEVPWRVYLLTVLPEDRDILIHGFRQLCTSEVIDIQMEVRIRRPQSNGFYWYEVSAFVYEWTKSGKPSVILASTTNIQKRKNQEITLEEAKDKAELADKMKSKYLADMSHEIRTPLTAITGFAELMAFAESDEERLSYYEIIKTNNQMLMQLINDILDLSKIEADVVKLVYEEVDINDMLDTAYASARYRMPEGVNLYIEKGLPHCMFGIDPIRFLQIITNLSNNAIKHTKKGSITVGYTELEKGLLKFFVRDTGLGISKEKQARLFNRFAKMNDYAEGIGLGLAICQGLITKMGGSINVTSELGIGSEFSFTLPSHTVEKTDEV